MKIIGEIINNIGFITLNRPEKLNALDLEMIRDLKKLFINYEEDKNVKLIVVRGNGKSFCAGGDVVKVYKDHILKNKDYSLFFKEEFELDNYISNTTTPVLSICHGNVMGGGIGISIDSDFSIFTTNSKWAMPEILLGIFPDVGVGSYISKLPKELGLYISLIGKVITGEDAVKLGFGTNYIDENKVSDLVEDLKRLKFNIDTKQEVKNILNKYERSVGDFSFSADISSINKHFSKNSLEEIIESLKNDDTDFSKLTLDKINSSSPLSLVIIYKKYFAGKNWSREQTYPIDLKILNYCVENGDACEGIRTTLIDKNDIPKFKHSSVKDIDLNKIDNLLK